MLKIFLIDLNLKLTRLSRQVYIVYENAMIHSILKGLLFVYFNKISIVRVRQIPGTFKKSGINGHNGIIGIKWNLELMELIMLPPFEI